MTNSLYWKSRDAFERARLAIVKRRDFLLENHPEIVEQYRNGASLADLAQKYFPEDYQISENIAKNSVLHALAELLDPEEKKEIGLQHKRQSYKKRKDLDQNKKPKDPERVALGKRSYQSGLSKLTSEELAKTCINTMIQKGIFPYEGETRFVSTGLDGVPLLCPLDEKEFILYLRENGNTWYEIEAKVNKEFRADGKKPRKANSLRVVYQNWKKTMPTDILGDEEE